MRCVCVYCAWRRIGAKFGRTSFLVFGQARKLLLVCVFLSISTVDFSCFCASSLLLLFLQGFLLAQLLLADRHIFFVYFDLAFVLHYTKHMNLTQMWYMPHSVPAWPIAIAFDISMQSRRACRISIRQLLSFTRIC